MIRFMKSALLILLAAIIGGAVSAIGAFVLGFISYSGIGDAILMAKIFGVLGCLIGSWIIAQKRFPRLLLWKLKITRRWRH